MTCYEKALFSLRAAIFLAVKFLEENKEPQTVHDIQDFIYVLDQFIKMHLSIKKKILFVPMVFFKIKTKIQTLSC